MDNSIFYIKTILRVGGTMIVYHFSIIFYNEK
jgi:hypothetical protein